MWASLITSAFQTGANIYASKKVADARNKIAALQRKTRSVLTARALSTIHNTTQKAKDELTAQMRRREFDIISAVETARGNAVAAAANAGATGQRNTLAIAQATEGAADRELGRLAADTAMQQDALLLESNYRSEQAILQLLAGPVDAPSSYSPVGDILQFASTGLQTYEQYQINKGSEQEQAISGVTNAGGYGPQR
jgi:hypothetical protein